MGEIVEASCGACGFDRVLEIGGGMQDFETHSYFPYLCDLCGMVSANIAQNPVVCPSDPTHQIKRYGSCRQERMAQETVAWEPDAPKPTWIERIGLKRRKLPAVQSIDSLHPICQWDDHEILAGSYECPACRKLALSFTGTGELFD